MPLNLFHCDFRKKTCRKTEEELLANEEDLLDISNQEENASEVPDIGNWIYNEENLQKLIENIQSEWSQFSIKYVL